MVIGNIMLIWLIQYYRYLNKTVLNKIEQNNSNKK